MNTPAELLPIDLLVHGAAEVATPLGDVAIGGSSMGRVQRVQNGAVAIDAGRIVAIGTERDLAQRYAPQRRLDAAGGLVLPGFVDAHTHPVFFGTRELEFEQRNAGATYLEISTSGGGILSSVRGVRGASEEQLTLGLLERLDRFLELGTTTVECKSGYGLSTEAELVCLRAIAAANAVHVVELVPTFLGAHAIPPEFEGRTSDYVDLLCAEMLPLVAESGLAQYADIFTEAHTFGVEDSRRVMLRARELGLGLRMHVDQLTPLGGAELAAELGAATADHLEHVSNAGIDALLERGVQPVLCPLVPIFLRESDEAPGRSLVDAGLAAVISTDFNPGSCYTQSMPEVATFAALRYGFSAAECLTGATLNAAATLGLAGELGTLEPGKRADVIVLDVPNLEHLTYEFGRDPVVAVIKGGELVTQRAPRERRS